MRRAVFRKKIGRAKLLAAHYYGSFAAQAHTLVKHTASSIFNTVAPATALKGASLVERSNKNQKIKFSTFKNYNVIFEERRLM
jgi:hypothetical protein